MRDRRREQRNRRVPAESSRQREVGQPQRENLGVDAAARRQAVSSPRRWRPRPPRADVSAPATMSRKASANPSKLAASERSRRSAAVRSVGASSRDGPQGETAPQPMDAPGGAGVRARRLGARCSASRSAEESSRWRASAAQAVAARKRQALAQRAGERRIEAKNLIQQSEAGAGEESRLEARVGADGWLFRRPRPGRKRLFQQWVGRRGTAARRSRRDRRRGAATGASPRGSAAAVSSSKGSAGCESNHGFSITQGGALSSCLAPNPPRLS